MCVGCWNIDLRQVGLSDHAGCGCIEPVSLAPGDWGESGAPPIPLRRQLVHIVRLIKRGHIIIGVAQNHKTCLLLTTMTSNGRFFGYRALSNDSGGPIRNGQYLISMPGKDSADLGLARICH